MIVCVVLVLIICFSFYLASAWVKENKNREQFTTSEEEGTKNQAIDYLFANAETYFNTYVLGKRSYDEGFPTLIPILVKTGIADCYQNCNGACVEYGYSGIAQCYKKKGQPTKQTNLTAPTQTPTPASIPTIMTPVSANLDMSNQQPVVNSSTNSNNTNALTTQVYGSSTDGLVASAYQTSTSNFQSTLA